MEEEFEFFAITDLLSFTFWFFLIVIYCYLRHNNKKHLSHYKYFYAAFFSKMAFGMIFALIYMLYYKGGDTIYYWDCGVKLERLFFKDPSLYFKQIFGDNSWENYYNFYDTEIGYPPDWIYKEKEGLFVGKITSLFCFITLNSFLSITLLFSFIMANASWKLFEMFLDQKVVSPGNAFIATFCIPTVSFWCSGIMKDTLVLICLFYLLSYAHLLINKKPKRIILVLATMVFLCFIIYTIRTFILIAFMPPLLIGISDRIARNVKNKAVRLVFIRGGSIALVFIFLFLYISNSKSFGEYSSEKMIGTAVELHDDFAYNTTYGENKYDIGPVDNSPGSMLVVAPQAIIAALYRPFLWETNNILMLFSGLESMVFIFLTIRFLYIHKLTRWVKYLKTNEFILFSIMFILVFGYFVGFTSGLFGTLVRFKAPIMPFFMLILLLKPIKKIENTEAEI